MKSKIPFTVRGRTPGWWMSVPGQTTYAPVIFTWVYGYGVVRWPHGDFIRAPHPKKPDFIVEIPVDYNTIEYATKYHDFFTHQTIFTGDIVQCANERCPLVNRCAVIARSDMIDEFDKVNHHFINHLGRFRCSLIPKIVGPLAENEELYEEELKMRYGPIIREEKP